MTIHVNAETVRQLVEKHVRNLYPGKLLKVFGPISVNELGRISVGNWRFDGYEVTVLDQSPFDLPPDKVKAGFDRARDAINRIKE